MRFTTEEKSKLAGFVSQVYRYSPKLEFSTIPSLLENIREDKLTEEDLTSMLIHAWAAFCHISEAAFLGEGQRSGTKQQLLNCKQRMEDVLNILSEHGVTLEAA